MSLRFECPNGHPLYATEAQVGKTYACPKCGESVCVPDIVTDSIKIVEPPKRSEQPFNDQASSNPLPRPAHHNKLLLGAVGGVLVAGLLFGCYLLIRRSSLQGWSNPLGSASSATSSPEAMQEKLRKIGVAWLNFESQTKRFIPINTSQLSWRVHLLPYLDQLPLYEQFKLDEPWDSPHNLKLVPFMPEVFSLPDTSREEGKTRFQTPVGPELVFGNSTVPRYSTITDGAENTLLAVVVGRDKSTVWTKPDDLRIAPDAPIESLGALPEAFLAGVTAEAKPVLMLPEISPSNFYAILTPRGGEAVDVQGLIARFEASRISDAVPRGSKNGVGTKGSLVPTEAMIKERKTKLKDVGLALLNYESAFKTYPIAKNTDYFDESGKAKLSWRVHLLPFLGQQPLYNQFKLNERWDSPHNLQLLEKMPDVFRDPADPVGSTKTRSVRLTGAVAPFKETGPGPPRREFIDGDTSTLFLISCGADRAVPWTAPDDLPFDENSPVGCLGKPDCELILGVFCDNRIAAFNVKIPPEVFKCYVTHASKEVVGNNPFLLEQY